MATTDSVPLTAHRPATGRRLALEQVRLLPPIARPPKFLCVARNYASHSAEMGADLSGPDRNAEQTSKPGLVVFNKQSSCVVGPDDAVWIPRDCLTVDYEGELGVVIGRHARRVDVSEALNYVAGYVVVNDISVREWQRESPTFTLGKSFETHGPIGPWLVTADEVADPQTLRITTRVNGEVRQSESTSQMVWTVAEIVSFLSQRCTLEPGDVIATGTPSGVGAGSNPPRWLVAGDTVEVEIDAIGTLRNFITDEPDSCQ